MPTKSKNWQERITRAKAPEVKLLTFDFAGLKSGTTLLISSPHEVENYIRQIPSGETRSIQQVRADLATQNKADATCPVSTPIFLRVVSEAAFESLKVGQTLETITPFWRVVEPESKLGKKLECGSEFIRAQRVREGIF